MQHGRKLDGAAYRANTTSYWWWLSALVPPPTRSLRPSPQPIWQRCSNPCIPADAVLCTDGSAALAAAARHLGIEHRAIKASSSHRTAGPWHINNVNGYHARLNWLRRFKGVTSSYLDHYLGWFRTPDRLGQAGVKPSRLLALAIGV
jgi:hypothetical protein